MLGSQNIMAGVALMAANSKSSFVKKRCNTRGDAMIDQAVALRAHSAVAQILLSCASFFHKVRGCGLVVALSLPDWI
jgi:hypothetical protein